MIHSGAPSSFHLHCSLHLRFSNTLKISRNQIIYSPNFFINIQQALFRVELAACSLGVLFSKNQKLVFLNVDCISIQGF